MPSREARDLFPYMRCISFFGKQMGFCDNCVQLSSVMYSVVFPFIHVPAYNCVGYNFGRDFIICAEQE